MKKLAVVTKSTKNVWHLRWFVCQIGCWLYKWYLCPVPDGWCRKSAVTYLAIFPYLLLQRQFNPQPPALLAIQHSGSPWTWFLGYSRGSGPSVVSLNQCFPPLQASIFRPNAAATAKECHCAGQPKVQRGWGREAGGGGEFNSYFIKAWGWEGPGHERLGSGWVLT